MKLYEIIIIILNIMPSYGLCPSKDRTGVKLNFLSPNQTKNTGIIQHYHAPEFLKCKNLEMYLVAVVNLKNTGLNKYEEVIQL